MIKEKNIINVKNDEEKKKKGSIRMAEPNKLIPSNNLNKQKYLNVVLNKKEKETFDVVSKVKQFFHTNDIIYNINKYINFSEEKNNEGKLIPQRSEHVFQVDVSNISNYINLSVYNIDAENALVAQRSEHLSQKQGLPRHLGSSPSQGAVSASEFNENNSGNVKRNKADNNSINDIKGNFVNIKDNKVRNDSREVVNVKNDKANCEKRTFEFNKKLACTNNFKLFSIIILSVILLILLIGNVLSLGVTPGRTTFNYESGMEKEVEFSILNNEHKNMQVLLTVQGEMNSSVTLFNGTVDFLPSEESKSFKFRFKAPDIGNSPGLHTAEIVALEIPKANAQGTYVGATVAVVSQIHLYIAYPGKYLDADLNVLDGENNGTATFIVPIINRGKLGIGSARAVIDIYTTLNEKVDSIETDTLNVEPGARTELSAKWNVKVASGNYIAKVTLLYDGETRSFEKPFGIGEQLLSIESILVNNFRLGEIAKLQILVENKWSQQLESVFANLLVYNKENQVMADIKSSSEIIPALAKKELVAYWDTVGVKEGEYSGKLMVKYGQKSSDKNLVLKVSQDSLDVTGVGYAIRPQGGKGTNLTTILLIVVVLLLLVNLAWFVFFRRILGKKKK